MGTFIEIISTPTSYSVNAGSDPVWSTVDSAIDVTGYKTIDIEVLVYSLTSTGALAFMTATTRADDDTLWSEVETQPLVDGPGTDETANILRLTIGATSGQPLLRYLRWRFEGNASNNFKVLLTVRGIGRTG